MEKQLFYTGTDGSKISNFIIEKIHFKSPEFLSKQTLVMTIKNEKGHARNVVFKDYLQAKILTDFFLGHGNYVFFGSDKTLLQIIDNLKSNCSELIGF